MRINGWQAKRTPICGTGMIRKLDQLEGDMRCPMCGAHVSATLHKCGTCGELLQSEPVRRAQVSFTTPFGNLLYLAPFLILVSAAVLLPLIAWLRKLLDW